MLPEPKPTLVEEFWHHVRIADDCLGRIWISTDIPSPENTLSDYEVDQVAKALEYLGKALLIGQEVIGSNKYDFIKELTKGVALTPFHVQPSKN